MNKENTYRVIFWVLLLFISLTVNNLFATHAQSADITYQCLGINQYEVSVSFYRDCAGVNAPNTITVNTSSLFCNQNFNTTLSQITGTGLDVTPICNTLTTICNGGAYPGVEEYIYRGVITLPMSCPDWTFSFTLCCRNNAINTINNPGGENIYVEAVLNNLDFTCNNSPTFSNPPVSFPCVGQTSCLNYGATDLDGDSLYYSLISPATGPTTTVTYLAGYSAQQPLISNPAVTFNPLTGDICMTPTLVEVTVLAIKVEEWRNEILVGSVVRDIQLRTVACNNSLPYLNGINGTGQYAISGCVGTPISFNIPSFDLDAGQTLTLNWNNAISGASFISNGAQLPMGVFNWTPTQNDVSTTPYCFTITVTDDNCPYNGLQIYSFCITVGGFTATMSSTNVNCGASNGTATVSTQNGASPFSYQWSPNGGSNATANGLQAGQYTVVITDALGCTYIDSITVGSNPQPGNITITPSSVSCYSGNDGSATVILNGGQTPYTYLWSNGDTTQTITNLPPGTYYVQVTTSAGCVKTDSITITAPSSPITAITTQSNVSCFAGNNGSATVIPSGGTSPYTVTWNTTPIQNGLTATGLTNGIYTVIVTDINGCSTSQDVTISQPLPLNFSLSYQQNANCFGGSDGLISMNINGGTSPYSYNWNNNAFPDTNTITNLTAGIYLLNITDANGCIANNQYTITEPPELITSVTNFTNMSCNGVNDGTIQTNTIGGTLPYSYQWTPSTSMTSNATNLGFGYYVLLVTDSNGCIDTTGATINEPAAIVTILQGGDTICPGQTSTLIATTYGGTGNYTYQWNNGNTGATQTVLPSSTTTYSVFAIDVNGCTGPVENVIVLVNDINLVNLTTVPDTTLCEGSPYLISANISGGIGPYSFNWNNGLGQGQGPFVVAPLLNTVYIVTITDVCGNSINESVIVNVNPLPNVSLQPQTGIACGELVLNLSNSASNPTGTTYFWEFGDGTNSNQENPSKVYTQTGIYNVILTLTSPEGCINSNATNMNVTVYPKPIAQFNFDPKETTILNPKISFDNYSVDSDFYNWTFGDGAISTEINPIHDYIKEGTYIITLIASNIYGCKDTVIAELLIDPHFNFYIPNAFTPDGNGRNDIFTAVGEAIDEFSMLIFNRWGELIYETSNLEKGWDGSAKGGSEISMEGVYVYKIRIKDWQGINHKFIGHVSLLK